MSQKANCYMDEDLFNALQFTQANDLNQFVGSYEYNIAIQEFVIEIIGGINVVQ